MAERRADEASWEVVGWLKCEYMKGHIGDQFKGTINAVTSFGIFVELDDVFVEGLVHISSLPGDYYHFDQAKNRLQGERSGRSFRLGDSLQVKVIRVDLDEKKIDFELSEARAKNGKKDSYGKGKGQSKRRRKR